MNIIEALKSLKSNGASAVRNTNNDTLEISELIATVEECENLEDTSDKGEWAVDGDGIEQLNDEGCRTGNRYNVAE